MKKFFGIVACLSVAVFLHCTDEQSKIDLATLVSITSGFSSSYISFTITGGLTVLPEYKVLNTSAGLTPNGSNYEGTFTSVDSGTTHSVSIVLPSPAADAEYLEDSANLFSYTRGTTALTVNAAYSAGNDFRVSITEWGGTGKFMKGTFSGVVCNSSAAGECLTIENGIINAMVK